jgi:hypothetical protein
MLSISIFASYRVENEFRYFSKVLGPGHDVRVSSWQRFQPFHLIFRMWASEHTPQHSKVDIQTEEHALQITRRITGPLYGTSQRRPLFALLASSHQTARETHQDLRNLNASANCFLSAIHSCLGDFQFVDHNLRMKYFRQNVCSWIIKLLIGWHILSKREQRL